MDWGNDWVQVFDPEGDFVTRFLGDARMSKLREERLASNPENMLGQRQLVESLDPEKRFVQPVAPVAMEVDPENRIIVVDSARHRLQIYQKEPA